MPTSPDTALVPNVYLAHHPDLDTDCLYDHVHLYKNLVHILAKRLKYVTLNSTNQTSPRWSRTSPDPAKQAKHASRNSIPHSTSSRAPSRASAPREEPHRQRLLYKSPTAPPPVTPPEPERQSYAQAVSGGVNPASAELHSIQHMLSIICSHLLTHSVQNFKKKEEKCLQLVDVPHYSHNLYFTVASNLLCFCSFCVFLFFSKWQTNSIEYLSFVMKSLSISLWNIQGLKSSVFGLKSKNPDFMR